MANLKISELPGVTQIKNTDVIPIVQKTGSESTTKKVSVGELKDYVEANSSASGLPGVKSEFNNRATKLQMHGNNGYVDILNFDGYGVEVPLSGMEFGIRARDFYVIANGYVRIEGYNIELGGQGVDSNLFFHGLRHSVSSSMSVVVIDGYRGYETNQAYQMSLYDLWNIMKHW